MPKTPTHRVRLPERLLHDQRNVRSAQSRRPDMAATADSTKHEPIAALCCLVPSLSTSTGQATAAWRGDLYAQPRDGRIDLQHTVLRRAGVSAGVVAGPFGAVVSLPTLPNALIGDYRTYEVLG